MKTFYEKYGISEKVFMRACINGVYALNDELEIVKVSVEKVDLECKCFEVYIGGHKDILHFEHFRKFWGVMKTQLCRTRN